MTVLSIDPHLHACVGCAPRSRVRGAALVTALLVTMLLAGACQAATPRPETEREIAAATGNAEVLSLSIEGHALDEPLAEDVLSYPDAVRRALASSPELQAALAAVRVALADADQARLLANPVLSLVLRLPSGGGASVFETGLSQELLGILQRPSRVRASDQRLRRAVAEAVATSLTVVAELSEAYAAVQALDELVPLLGERRTLLERLLEVMRARVAADEAAGFELTALEVQALEVELERGMRESERRDRRLTLARRVGAPSAAAEWRLSAWSPLPESLPPESVWIERALVARPEVQARRWELAALGDDAALAVLAPLEGVELGLAAERDGEWSLGPAAALPLPVFDTGRVGRERAAAEIVAARHELVRVQREVIEEVRRAHAALGRTTAGLARVRAELLPLLRRRREQVEAVYLAGETHLDALILAEHELQAGQARLVELERDANVAFVRLQRAVGGAGVAGALLEPVDGRNGIEDQR